MNRSKSRTIYGMLLFFALSFVFFGCGGGGGGGGGNTPPPLSSAKAITDFSLDGVSGTIDETAKTIAVAMPYGTDVMALVATFTITGTYVKVGANVQTSGAIANDFTNPVVYTVTAADGSIANYTVTVTVALSPAKAITAFTLGAVNGTIDETAKTIAVVMPYGTNVTALIATFTTTGASVKVGSTIQTSGATANNFTSSVVYTVTAADGSTENYTVSVTVASISAKAITSFSLSGVSGTINETAKSIAVVVPYGTNVTALVATFTTSGASVKVGSTVQTSGTTANNFSSPVIYTVTAADGILTAGYTVTVTVALNPAKAITSFSLKGVNGSINETAKTIAVVMPNSTSDVTALVATFTTTGVSVKVGSTVQTSGTTANNFSSPVIYTVTAADSTTADYTVTVTVAASSAKAITSFSFSGVSGTINETTKSIAVVMPNGTNVTALVATFASTGANVKVGATLQTSGSTANDFTNPLMYTVTAADASTVNYAVTVTVALNTAKAITAFSLAGVTGTINETSKTIAVTMPYGTDVSALIATFTTTGESVKVGTTPQTSGATSNNFTSPAAYTVTAADDSTAVYTVTVTVALNSAKAITAFSLDGVIGTINQTAKTITVEMPNGTNVTSLIATFTITGVNVKVGASVQTSGTTANDFTSPVVYKVTAADGSTASYTVTVALNTAKAITAFSLAGVAGTINETAKTITVDLPYGKDVTALEATFTTTGASVKVGASIQISGGTQNDFTTPLVYTVIAGDGSTVNYTVTVNVGLNPAKAITAFNLDGAGGEIDETAKTIAVVFSYGTNVTALVATFTSTGASVKVGASVQTSGATANDFTNPVVYTVTAADGTTANYTVNAVVNLKAPTGLVRASTNNGVDLAWDAVAGAETYNLYYGTSSGVTKLTGSKVTHVGTVTPGSIVHLQSGLTNGEDYYFVVTATATKSGIALESELSNEVYTIPNPYGFEFVLVPAGNYTMGSPDTELGRNDFTEYQHHVILTNSFFITETEVTQSQWRAVAMTSPEFHVGCNDCPVEQVSWNNVVNSFLVTLNTHAVLQGNYRLPTEAEWEYAARAGSTTAFANGEITVLGADVVEPVLDQIGWYGYNTYILGRQTQNVRGKIANGWGLYDMHGNVIEMVKDWYQTDLRTAQETDPEITTGSFGRVTRGGSFGDKAEECRSAYRASTVSESSVDSSIGFRLVRDP